MVLYIVEECGMPCFSLAVTEWQMSIRTAEVQSYIFCFGGGTSVARRDQGGGLALPESCWGFCRSRYDAYNPKSAMKIVHHWNPTLMHLGCMIEIYIYIYIYNWKKTQPQLDCHYKFISAKNIIFVSSDKIKRVCDLKRWRLYYSPK